MPHGSGVRANQNDAVLTIEPVDGSWKITEIDLREEQRVDANSPNRIPSPATSRQDTVEIDQLGRTALGARHADRIRSGPNG